MRWQVEMTPIGKTEGQSVVVDAESWQKALQAARTNRGESGPMSGFSIELLEQGYRAVDPMSRLVYVVKRLEEGAAGSAAGSSSGGVPSAKPAEARPEPAKPESARLAARPPAAPRPPSNPPPAGANAKSQGAVVAAPPPAVPAEAATMRDLPKDDSAPERAKSSAQVIFKREQDPSPAAPLTYREYAYAVATGTKEEDAERVLFAEFELVKKTLAGARAGKFVNLAVFDAVFKGKPDIPPIATLSWKDWRGAPVIEFPRRKPASRAPSAPPAKSAPQAAPVAVPPPPAALFSAPAAANAAPKPEPLAAPAQNAFPVVSAPLAPAPTPGPGPTDRPYNRASRVPQTRGRAKGDELITALFESMHDLHFLRDAVEGGDFCLSLALETLPSSGGIVHMYDIDKREFVVACAAGKGSEGLLLGREPESEALLLKAMRHRRALVVPDATTEEGGTAARYGTFGGAKSLIIAPVLYGGRFLGAIELVNPTDGNPFTEDEGNALSYIAEQFAEFVSQRGVVLDAERIAQRGTVRAH